MYYKHVVNKLLACLQSGFNMGLTHYEGGGGGGGYIR